MPLRTLAGLALVAACSQEGDLGKIDNNPDEGTVDVRLYEANLDGSDLVVEDITGDELNQAPIGLDPEEDLTLEVTNGFWNFLLGDEWTVKKIRLALDEDLEVSDPIRWDQETNRLDFNAPAWCVFAHNVELLAEGQTWMEAYPNGGYPDDLDFLDCLPE